MTQLLDSRAAPARDDLTGLFGLDAVRDRLEHWLQPGAANAPSIHALLLGLPRFDAVNLAYGAAAGDGALAEVADRMVQCATSALSGPWLAARGGGGSFVLVANEACSRERWQLFAGQLGDAIARPIARAGGSLRLSPRIALLRGLPAEDSTSILDRLAQTLSTVSRQQGRRVLWADGENAGPGRTSAQLESDLLAAIDGNQIEILFQPQYSLPDDRLSGAEALARWNHPELGLIGAGSLFAIAERADHVAPLSRHIAQRALADAASWPAELRLSLNVTPGDLVGGTYPDALFALLDAGGLAAERLTVEVTEQVLLADLPQAARTLEAMSARGLRIALDDFGAGFCNFRYLKVLPLHYLKLDRSMVDGVASDPRDLAVLRAIVAMARALELEVIAEGIETESQRSRIAAEGCAFYQGFLRAKPMTADEFARVAKA